MRCSRRRFLAAAAGGAAGLALGPLGNGATGKPRRPNVVFILTDDQRLDAFGFLRHKALTPHMDRLATEGVTFRRGYVSSSVCTPARYTCLTGRYASRARSRNFLNATSPEGQTCVQWNVDIRPGDPTLPKALRKAGYATGFVGKWHNGAPAETRKRLQKVRPDADPADADVSANLRAAQDALHQYVRSCGFDYAEAVNLGNFGAHPCRALRYHNQEWITHGALEFIDRNRDRPFFLYLATSLLHGPSPLKSLQADPRITHAGLLEKPPNVQPSRENVLRRTRAAGIHPNLAAATWLDDGIGAVLQRLDKLHLTDNTLVIFLSDHGVERGKGSCYEGGVRTPIVIRWPGRAKPRACDALVQNIDFAPTILDACRADPPPETPLDGKSLLPLLAGTAKKVHDSLYFEIGYTRAVVTDRWKYLAFRIPPSRQLTAAQRQKVSQRYAQRKTSREDKAFKPTPDAPLSHMGFPGGQSTERGNAIRRYAGVYHDADQLFDLQTDPGETTNLATTPAHHDTLERMRALLRKHLAGVPGTFAELHKGNAEETTS